MFTCSPFEPRPIAFDSFVGQPPFRLKKYRIHAPTITYDDKPFAAGVNALELPEEIDVSTPGVGFLIHHVGFSNGTPTHYVVVGYWFSGNELCLRTVVSMDEGQTWDEDEERFAPCVWDHEVIWHERNAYVKHVMNGSPDLDAYLSDVFRQG